MLLAVLWLTGCGGSQPPASSQPGPAGANETGGQDQDHGASTTADGTSAEAAGSSSVGANDSGTGSAARGAGPAEWPTFLGPTGDNKSTETGITAPWPADGLKILWSRELGISYGIGSISQGRLYQFDRFGDNARLTCMDARTGQDIWTFEYPTDYEDLYQYNGGPRCSPVVDGERVYIFGVEGMLHCLRTSDGQPEWKVDTARQFGVVQNFFGVGSTPVLEGDLLIVMVGGSPAESKSVAPGQLDQVTGNGSGIVAFDKRTGEVKYQITSELASYASLKSATINGRRWCFAFCRGGLVGFEPATGRVDFEYPWRARLLESVNASTPVVVGDQVLISETYGPGSSLLQVKPGGYDIVWRDDENSRQKAMQTHWNTPIHHQGYLYGSSGRHTNDAELRCVEWATGKVMWSEPGLTRSSLLYVDNHFICLTEYGQLVLLKANPEKFEPLPPVMELTDERGRNLLKYPCWAAPILVDGRLYVRGDDRLVCLELIPPK
ncbi:MAG: PQQ-like beta-propeller repeat protein [Pirellulaceae bacterium]|nr:PQQ-like beta-propeller repeat protein [Pirellulaceae bacterium]